MKWSKQKTTRVFVVTVLSIAILGHGSRLVLHHWLDKMEAPVNSTPKEQVLTSCYRFSKNVFSSTTLNAYALHLGVEYVKKKQYSLAKRVFEEVLALEPTNPSILNNLAFIAGEENDLAKAAEYLRTSIQIAPKCAECFNNLGSVLFRQNKMDEAKHMFEEAVRIDPKYTDPRLNLAMILEEKGEWANALEMYHLSEPHISDIDLKRMVNQRSNWMAEIAQNAKRNVAGEGNK